MSRLIVESTVAIIGPLLTTFAAAWAKNHFERRRKPPSAEIPPEPQSTGE